MGHDDLGDTMAIDEKGVVFCFAHGMGDWSSRTKAFASVDAMQRYVAFQSKLDVPHELDLEQLKAAAGRAGTRSA